MPEIRDKKLLRKEALSIRNSLSQDLRSIYSDQILDKVLGLKEYREAENVLTYISVGSEVSTRKLIEQALSDGKRLALPKTFGGGRMVFLQIDSMDDLQMGSYNIPEPVSGRELTEGLVIIPGLAFDPDKNRMGYGGGFYDRWLSLHPENVFKCALAYDMQLLGQIPHEDNDIRMDCIITNSGIYD